MRETAIVVFTLLTLCGGSTGAAQIVDGSTDAAEIAGGSTDAAEVVGGSTAAAERVEPVVRPVILANYGGDWFTEITSINNHGEMAGWATRDDDEWVAFIRTRRGRDVTIAERAVTRDINERGEVVGVLFQCNEEECSIQGFIWSRERGLQTLDAFHPFAINDHGDMAGVCSAEEQACVVRDGLLSAVAGPGSEAHGINNKGEVVGVYGDNRAFHVSRRGRFTDLGRAAAEDINDKGVIAGHRFIRMGGLGERARATAWVNRRARSPRRDASVGVAINNKGWAVGYAQRNNGPLRSFAWHSLSNRRVVLGGSAGVSVLVNDIADSGDAVGSIGGRPALWRVRGKQHDDDD